MEKYTLEQTREMLIDLETAIRNTPDRVSWTTALDLTNWSNIIKAFPYPLNFLDKDELDTADPDKPYDDSISKIEFYYFTYRERVVVPVSLVFTRLRCMFRDFMYFRDCVATELEDGVFLFDSEKEASL